MNEKKTEDQVIKPTYETCPACKKAYSRELAHIGNCPYCHSFNKPSESKREYENATRLWCSQHKEWEKDPYVIGANGSVYDAKKLMRGQVVTMRVGPMGVGTGNHILEQSIGMSDRVNRLIYVGDLVDQWGDASSIIVIEDLRSAHYMMTECTLGDSCLVVGNIHDNPDMAALIATMNRQRFMTKLIPPPPDPATDGLIVSARKLGGMPESVKNKK